MTGVDLALGMVVAALVWLLLHEANHQARRRAAARRRQLAYWPHPIRPRPSRTVWRLDATSTTSTKETP